MENDRKEVISTLAECINNFKRSHMQRIMNSNMNVKPSEIHLLFHLKKIQSDQGVKTSRLSELMRIAPPTITPMINSLESNGYIERIRSDSDRRLVLIRTTPKGDQIILQAEGFMQEYLGEIIDHLGDNDTSELIRILKKANTFLTEKRRKI